MNKLINKITAVLVLVFMAVFMLLTVFRAKSGSSFTENRRLASLPEPKVNTLYDGRFTGELNAYITDHFAGRSGWIAAKTAMETQLSEGIVNGVYVSEDRLLDAEISSRAPATFNADIFNEYTENYDGAVYFAAIPSSSGVYGDELPEHTVTLPENQQIATLYNQLSGDIRKIDAYNILKMLNDNYIYYRSDTKWTCYGAYCVYRTVIQKLGFLPTPYDKYSIAHVTDSFRGNLYNRTLSEKPKADILDIYEYPDGAEMVSCNCIDVRGNIRESSLYDLSKLDSSYMYSMYMGDDVPVVKITTSVNNDRRLLVIKDSYADCFIPFLIQHYSEITVVSPEALSGKLTDYLDPDSYGQTLFLFGIENLGDRTSLEKIIERKN